MKSFEYEAVAVGCNIYCIGCIPLGIADDPLPIFADSEWDSYPVCDRCGTVHEYVTLISTEQE